MTIKELLDQFATDVTDIVLEEERAETAHLRIEELIQANTDYIKLKIVG